MVLNDFHRGSKRRQPQPAFFIIANSAIGLIVHSLNGTIDLSLLLPLSAVALVGGFIGSKFEAF